MADNNYMYGDEAQATENLSAAKGVSPDQAAAAVKAAPSTGVPPSIGMYSQQGNDIDVIPRNTSVSSFMAQSPAHAAVAQDDVPALTKISQMAQDFASKLAGVFKPQGNIITGPTTENPIQSALRGFAEDVAGQLYSPPGTTRQQAGQTLIDIVGTALGGLRGAPEAAGGRLGEPLTGEAPPPSGPPHVTPEGPAKTPEGFVADENGAPVQFTTQREAATWASKNVPSEGNRFDFAVNENGSAFHVQEVPLVSPEAEIKAANADSDAQDVANLQGAVAESKLHSRVPQMMEEYLEQEMAGHTAAVDPETLIRLAQQGHEPFPEAANEIIQAARNGEDFEIPLSRYLAATSGQPFADELNGAARFREDGVSQLDAKENTAEGGTTVVPPGNVEAPKDLSPEETTRAQYIAAAAQEQLQQVVKEQRIEKLFTDSKAIGMSNDQFSRYGERIDESVQAASDRMLDRAYKQILRERKPDWQNAVAQHSATVERELAQRRDIQARSYLQMGKGPLGEPIEKPFKLTLSDPLTQHMRDLGLSEKMFARNGLTPDEAATVFGYRSGTEMIDELKALQDDMEGRGLEKPQDHVKALVREEAQRRTEAELGYDLTPESIYRAASEALNGPALTEFLADELKPLAESAGVPFDKDEIRNLARERFEEKNTRDVLNLKKMENYVYRSGVKAEKALQKGDFLRAFLWKQTQFIQHLQLAESHKFTRQFNSLGRVIDQIARKPVVKGMDQEARNQLRNIVQRLGYPVRTKKFATVEESLRGQTLEDYISKKNAEGIRPAYVPLPVTPPKDGLKGVTVGEFRGYDDMIRSIGKLGRDERMVEAQGEQQQLSDIVQQIKQNANAIGRRVTAADLHTIKGKIDNEPGFFRRLLDTKTNPGSLRRQAQAAVVRSETMLYWMDQQGVGPFMKYIIGPLQDGKYYKADKIAEIGKGFKDLMKTQPKGWQDTFNQKVNIPELTHGVGADGLPVPWIQYRGQAIMAARYLGERTALDKLLKGFQWNEQTFREVLNRELSEADWKYVQHTWDMHEKLLPEIQELYRKESGLPLKTEKPIPVPTPYGTLNGGHVHVEYDWSSIGEFTDEDGNTFERKDPNALGNSDLFGSNYRTATPPNGYTLDRTNFSAPVNFDPHIFPNEIESILHDLGYRSALIQSAKIMRQPAVRQAISEVLGPEYLGVLQNWLKDIARQASYDQEQLQGLASMVRGFRKRFTLVQIGYNVATMAKHGAIAMSHIQGETGLLPFAQAQIDLAKTDSHLRDFVYENFGEVRTAQANLDRDIRETLSDLYQKQGFLSPYQAHAYWVFGAVKQWEAQATALAKYRQLLDKGLDHDEAIALANKAVRDTQGAGSVVDLPNLWRGGNSLFAEIGKLTNLFTGFENTATNRMWLASREHNGFNDKGWAGGRRDFHKMWGSSLSYLIFPAILATFVDSLIHGKLDEFWHDLPGNLVKSSLGGSMPMGNFVASAVASRGKDLGDDPLIEAGKGFIYTFKNLLNSTSFPEGYKDGEIIRGDPDKVEDRWVQHAIDTAGYMTNMPVKPISRAGQFSWDLSQNHVQDEEPVELMRGILFGPTKEEAQK